MNIDKEMNKLVQVFKINNEVSFAIFLYVFIYYHYFYYAVITKDKLYIFTFY